MEPTLRDEVVRPACRYQVAKRRIGRWPAYAITSDVRMHVRRRWRVVATEPENASSLPACSICPFDCDWDHPQ
jgi:hypothetical protein